MDPVMKIFPSAGKGPPPIGKGPYRTAADKPTEVMSPENIEGLAAIYSWLNQHERRRVNINTVRRTREIKLKDYYYEQWWNLELSCPHCYGVKWSATRSTLLKAFNDVMDQIKHDLL